MTFDSLRPGMLLGDSEGGDIFYEIDGTVAANLQEILIASRGSKRRSQWRNAKTTRCLLVVGVFDSSSWFRVNVLLESRIFTLFPDTVDMSRLIVL